MLPKVIVYNSVSVDGAIKDFDVDIALHYEVLGRLGADALLVGSSTAKTGVEMFMKTVPPEEPSDFLKPETASDDERLLWVIPDSEGILQDLMHVHRKSGYAKDIVVLASRTTPKAYLSYLKQRNYDYIVAGERQVDLRLSLEELNKQYGVKTVVTDSGGVLVSALLDAGLVAEVYLLVSGQIVGKKAPNLFRTLKHSVKLKLQKTEILHGDHVLLAYSVLEQT